MNHSSSVHGVSSSASQEKLEKLAERMGPLGQKLLAMNRNTLVMALAFILSAGWALWKVRAVSPYEIDSVGETNLALLEMGAMSVSVIAESPAKGEGSTAELVDHLRINPSARQMALGGRGEKLFLFSLSETVFAPVAAPEVPTESLATTVDVMPRQVIAEQPPSLEGVKLDLVMVGNPSVALISGTQVTEGQKVFGWTVREIQSNCVILEWGNHTAQLKMR